ncbi:uncharacterized protein A4U43_C01F7620 [Asparagus officinalis]|uniref:Uncharacterized protein n=1 Tax=Asparagus officinalis TaxID=4686 RepID=A0A5P1FSC5_ASPOF|nr:uncharacterized protein A4U43_C01F7620 [Asparagus officinalis]
MTSVIQDRVCDDRPRARDERACCLRDLVGVTYAEEETKAMAAEIEVVDRPNDEGTMQWAELCICTLSGYRDPPAGVLIREGLHYNPYFPGRAFALHKMLIDGVVEYEVGTPATEAQMGKDVVSFLSWAAEPEMGERKQMGFKGSSFCRLHCYKLLAIGISEEGKNEYFRENDRI